MPARSKVQARAMFAAARGKSNIGIPQSVGQEFAKETHNVKSLPERLKKMAKKRKKR